MQAFAFQATRYAAPHMTVSHATEDGHVAVGSLDRLGTSPYGEGNVQLLGTSSQGDVQQKLQQREPPYHAGARTRTIRDGHTLSPWSLLAECAFCLFTRAQQKTQFISQGPGRDSLVKRDFECINGIRKSFTGVIRG